MPNFSATKPPPAGRLPAGGFYLISRSFISRRSFFVLSAGNRPQAQLIQLSHGNNGKRNSRNNQPLLPAKRHQPEGRGQRTYAQNYVKRNPRKHGKKQNFVRKHSFAEARPSVRADIERLKQLQKGNRHKGHRSRSLVAPTAKPYHKHTYRRRRHIHAVNGNRYKRRL
jgi:hypothetical protein